MYGSPESSSAAHCGVVGLKQPNIQAEKYRSGEKLSAIIVAFGKWDTVVGQNMGDKESN